MGSQGISWCTKYYILCSCPMKRMTCTLYSTLYIVICLVISILSLLHNSYIYSLSKLYFTSHVDWCRLIYAVWLEACNGCKDIRISKPVATRGPDKSIAWFVLEDSICLEVCMDCTRLYWPFHLENVGRSVGTLTRGMSVGYFLEMIANIQARPVRGMHLYLHLEEFVLCAHAIAWSRT